MQDDIPLINSRTWRLMYLRKASDDQRPISIIMKTGVSSINMDMAAAEWIDFVPISSRTKPSLSLPMLLAVLWREARISSWENSTSFPL